MDLSKFIEVIKDFFLDILGYLIPGIFFILVCNFCLLCEYQDIFVFSESSYDVSIIIVFSYVVGHILYGAAIWRDELKIRIMNSSSFSKIMSKKFFYTNFRITNPKLALKEIEDSKEFQFCIKLLKESNPEIVDYLDNSKKENFKPVRNILMSAYPNSEKKIYTFMFRSDMCNHISVSLFIITLLGIISFLFSIFGFPALLNNGNLYLFLYFILFPLIIMALSKTRMRFYIIAYSLIFPIFTSDKLKLTLK